MHCFRNSTPGDCAVCVGSESLQREDISLRLVLAVLHAGDEPHVCVSTGSALYSPATADSGRNNCARANS